MGAACGCDGNSATTSDELKQNEYPKSKDTPVGTSHAPQVQGKNNADARNVRNTGANPATS